MRLTFFTLLICFALAPVAQAVPVRSVPDVRGQSSVVDLTGTLTANDKKTIDGVAARGRSGGELYVAVIDTTEGEEPRAYATRLFNQLGLDDRTRNRGVLLLAALEDRKAEIIVGDGFPGSVTAVTDRIMSEVVVGYFRKKNPRAAMVEGAGALVDQVLLAPTAPVASSLVDAAPSSPPQADLPSSLPQPSASASSASPGVWRTVENTASANPLTFLGGLGGMGFVAFAGARRYLRNRPRACARCRQQMVRLDEAEDDSHLSSGERKEESLGSVDYDIWMCTGCESTIKLRYGAFFTRYSSCSACGAKTLSTKTTTLQSATEYSTGRARVDEDCRHCPHRNSYTRTIPKKPRSTSSSSSSSSRSSSSSSSSRGGGSSSGRGSSGGW